MHAPQLIYMYFLSSLLHICFVGIKHVMLLLNVKLLSIYKTSTQYCQGLYRRGQDYRIRSDSVRKLLKNLLKSEFIMVKIVKKQLKI